MGLLKTLLRIQAVLLGLGMCWSTCTADEVVIDGNAKSKVSIGDFDCSNCPNASTAMFSLFDGHESGTLTAGELWQFFDSQGVSSLDRLTLCLDIQASNDSTSSSISSMEFKIEDPSDMGNWLTEVSLRDDSLQIPDYEIASYKPEANLEIELGYDFMQRFSANSKERISIDVAGGPDAQPVISVAGVKRVNSMFLIGFSLFWAIIFGILYRWTKPQISSAPTGKNAGIPTKQQRALSA